MTLKETIVNSVATAVLLAAGSTIVGVKINDARQDDRIERLESLDDSVNHLSDNLNRVDKHLSLIDGRLEGEHEPRK